MSQSRLSGLAFLGKEEELAAKLDLYTTLLILKPAAICLVCKNLL